MMVYWLAMELDVRGLVEERNLDFDPAVLVLVKLEESCLDRMVMMEEVEILLVVAAVGKEQGLLKPVDLAQVKAVKNQGQLMMEELEGAMPVQGEAL